MAISWGPEPGWYRSALECWKVLRFFLLCGSPGTDFCAGFRREDQLLVAEFDLDMIEEVRNVWQFFRDRRPETYGKLTEL